MLNLQIEKNQNLMDRLQPTIDYLEKRVKYLLEEETRLSDQVREIQKEKQSHQNVLWGIKHRPTDESKPFEVTQTETKDETSN